MKSPFVRCNILFLFIGLIIFSACTEKITDPNAKEPLQQTNNSVLSKSTVALTSDECVYYQLGGYSQAGYITSYQDLIIETPGLYDSGQGYVQIFNNTYNVIYLPKPAKSASVNASKRYGSGIVAVVMKDGVQQGYVQDYYWGEETTEYINLSVTAPEGCELTQVYLAVINHPFLEWLPFYGLTVCYLPPCIAPTVTANSNLTEIWPANNKEVTIEFFGTLSNCCGDGIYTLVDEYGVYSYKGIINNGNYNIPLKLMASRKGGDKDGRKYIFTVNTSNSAGTATASVEVIVPHDQRK